MIKCNLIKLVKYYFKVEDLIIIRFRDWLLLVGRELRYIKIFVCVIKV